jgi:hypothetical protein
MLQLSSNPAVGTNFIFVRVRIVDGKRERD